MHHLAIGSGKDANIYALDRDNMGKFKGNADNIYQLITGQLSGGIDSKPSYFNSAALNARDYFSNNKFITPMVASGWVYVGTSKSVAVCGLL